MSHRNEYFCIQIAKMKRSLLLNILFLLIGFNGYAQDSGISYKPTHKIYSSNGKEVGYFKMLESLKSADIILFGELHNSSIIHWLQLQTTLDLLKDTAVSLKMGAEMYSTNQQNDIDEYLSGITNDKGFEKNTKQWNNYKTDYKPLMKLAKEKGVSFIACNSPKELSTIVFRKGIDSLNLIKDDSILSLIAPLPLKVDYNAPGYKELMETDFGSSHKMDTKLLVEAQALKDATMAHSILNNIILDGIFLHFNGDFHSKDRGGIVHWLNYYSAKKLDISTISSVESSSLDFNKEWKKQGDFIIVILDKGLKSY